MTKASKARQLSITLDNKVGLLADVTGAVAAAKVNVTAMCAYEMDKKGTFWLMTDGNAKAKKALIKLGGQVGEDDVVLVEMPDKAGELKKVADKVAAAGIDVHYMYATAGSKTRTICVLCTDNDKKTIAAINKR